MTWIQIVGFLIKSFIEPTLSGRAKVISGECFPNLCDNFILFRWSQLFDTLHAPRDSGDLNWYGGWFIILCVFVRPMPSCWLTYQWAASLIFSLILSFMMSFIFSPKIIIIRHSKFNFPYTSIHFAWYFLPQKVRDLLLYNICDKAA